MVCGVQGGDRGRECWSAALELRLAWVGRPCSNFLASVCLSRVECGEVAVEQMLCRGMKGSGVTPWDET